MFVFKRTKQSTDLSQLEVLKYVGKKFVINIDKGEVLKRSYFDFTEQS